MAANGDRPLWWDICEECGNATDWDWNLTSKGPVYFDVLGHRMILCKRCAQASWDVERLARIVNGD